MPDNHFLYTEVPIDYEKTLSKIFLPEDINKTIKKSQLTEFDLPNFKDDICFNHDTHFSRFFKSKSLDSLIPLFNYKTGNSSNSQLGDILTIIPIQLNNFEENSSLRSFSFLLPSNIIPNCITISEDEDSNQLIIDIILDINVFITLKLNISIFLNEDYLNLNNFYSWCNYSMPYSFDQRKPLLMKSFNTKTCIISTIDGGLLLLKRLNPLDQFFIVPLTNISYISSIKSKIFGKSKNINYIDFNDQSISIKSFIDIIQVTSNIFITISVDKIINIWSIESESSLKEINLNDFLPNSFKPAILSPCYPNSILKISNNLLSILLYMDNTYILTFKLDLDNLSLDLITQLTPPNCNKNWIPIDYTFIFRNEFSKIWISWVFGDCYFYQTCEIFNDLNNTIKWSSGIESNKFRELENLTFISKVENFNNFNLLNNYSIKFIQSQYSNKTIKLALNIYNSNYGFINKSIEDQLNDLIIKNIIESSSTTKDLQTEWIRFTSVCQDIHNKIANKVFAICFDNNSNIDFSNDPFLIVSRGNDSFSIIKRSTAFEMIYFNSIYKGKIDKDDFPYSDEININELMKLIDLILEYSKGFNNSTLISLSNLIIENFNNEEDNSNIKLLMSDIFEKYIVKVANESVVSELLMRLSKIEFASDLINFLTILLTTNYVDYKNNSIGKFNSFNEKLILKSIIFNNLIAEQILFGLALILNTLDLSKPIENLFKKVYDSFKYIKFIELISRLNLKDKMIIEYLDKVNNGITIKSDTINLTLVNIVKELFTNNFIYYIMSELYSNQNSDIAVELIKYLPKSSPISIVFKGLISLEIGQPEESLGIFMKNVKEITNYKLSEEEKISIKSISSTMKLIFVESEIDYFFNLTNLFEVKKYYIESLKLALESSKNLNKLRNTDVEKDNSIFYKIFELSLNLDEYKMSFSAIKEMSHRNRIIPLRKFIYKLFQENKLGTIIEFNYGEDLERIDELIFNMGEESLNNIETLGDIKLALKYYRICYSLRLKEGDFRGSIESLYRFNNIVLNYYENNKDKDKYRNSDKNSETFKILKNNYLVMINLMNSMKEDDKWIISKGIDGNGDKVVDGDELDREFVLFNEKYEDGDIDNQKLLKMN